MELMELGLFWEKILEKTRLQMNQNLWESSIHSGLLPISLENNILTLGVMQSYLKNFIEKNTAINEVLRQTAIEIYGQNLQINIINLNEATPNIESTEEQNLPSFSAEPTYDEPVYIDNFPKDSDFPNYPNLENYGNEKNSDIYTSSAPLATPTQDLNMANGTNQDATENLVITHSILNKTFTFENFVNGNSTRVAYAAAQYVSEHPAERYNPLFIYGKSGLGKTHLMHAIGNSIIKNYPHLKVMCLTSEDFTNIFINAIKSKQSNIFHQSFRNVDVLLVDDIQFLQDKGKTQEEFFHTFNTLFNDKKQIIFTSDILPQDMKMLEDRLRSRFQAGFTVTIEQPDQETRIAILRSMMDKELISNPHLQIANEVINYIATQFDKNVRVLQGAFNRLLGSISLENPEDPVDLNYAKRILADLIQDTEKPFLSVPYIQDFIASYFTIKKTDLLGQKRNKQFSHPRQIAMYLCRELVNESYPQISQAFGKKDHTTALHAYEKISKEISQNHETKRIITDIIDKINKK